MVVTDGDNIMEMITRAKTYFRLIDEIYSTFWSKNCLLRGEEGNLSIGSILPPFELIANLATRWRHLH